MNQHVFLLDHEVGQPRENQDCYLNYTQNHAEPVGKELQISRILSALIHPYIMYSISQDNREKLSEAVIISSWSFSPGLIPIIGFSQVGPIASAASSIL